MAIFKRNKETPQASRRAATREIGVAGEVVFESYDKEESRVDKVSIKDYRKMVDRDPTIDALYNIFTMPILSATYRLDADEDDKGEVQADHVRNNLFKPPHKGGMEQPFSLFLDQVLFSVVDGFALFEKVYRLNPAGLYELKKLAHRDSIGITLKRDDEGGYGGARQVVSYGGDPIDVVLPAYKTFLFTHDKARPGAFLYGRSKLKTLREPYNKKHKLEYLDSIALQTDAIKPKILKRTTDSLAGKDEGSLKNTILTALAKLGELKSVASIPFGYDVEVLKSEGRDPHQSIERQNSEMAREWLAPFLLLGSQGKSNVGSYALSADQSDMFMISLKGFMKTLEEHINQYIVADLIDLNFADRHYPEFHFDDLTSDSIAAIKDAFMKLVEKDKISAEMAEGIESSMANRLDIDIDQIKKERKLRSEEEAKDTTDEDDSGKPSGGKELSDMNIGDFPGLHEALGIDTDKLGCIMLDLRPFDVVKHVENGAADLVQATSGKDHVMGAVAEVQPHATLLFGLLQNGNTIKGKVDQVLNGWKCDSVVLDEIDSFPVSADAEAVPIIARLWNSDLREANKRLSLLPHVNTFGDYNPHVTLAYVKNDPDVVQKWVKALRGVIGGMRVTAVGINYGDQPDKDEEDDANSGGKFLSDDQKWHRPLTPAEQTVKFADIQKRMNTLEGQFIDSIKPVTDQVVKELVDKAMAAKSANDITIDLPKDYARTILSTIKTAYNYAKTGAADELKVAAPATTKEAQRGMQELTDLVVEKQQDDLKNLVRSEYLTAKRTRQLAEGDEESESAEDQQADFEMALTALLGAWFVEKLDLTASSIVSKSINNGRDDVFADVAEDTDVFQFSAILDGKCTAKVCPGLDGKVVSREEYERTRWRPPIHYRCRCLWILIRKISDSFTPPDVTGMPETVGKYSGSKI